MINFYSIYNNGSILAKHSEYSGFFERGSWTEYTIDQFEPYLSIIKKEPGMIFDYAKAIRKGRWEEGEPYIMKDPWFAYLYAKYIIKGRWPGAEPIIADVRGWAECYNNTFGTSI